MLEKLKALRASLDGKKTYLGMIAAGVLGILWSYGKVSNEQAGVAASLITTWTGFSFRAAIEKSGPPSAKL